MVSMIAFKAIDLGLTGFTALEGYFEVIGSILERFDDVWGLRLGLVSQSKLESKWFLVLRYVVGKARRQGGSSITFVQVWFSLPIPYQWYRYPNSTLQFGYRYLLGRVSVPLVLHQVSVPREGYRYPSPPLGLEYRYWHSSTDTSCLETVFGTP
ncbi:hypothetical protein GQ457_09G018650 [Hibiscus cannabinus]